MSNPTMDVISMTGLAIAIAMHMFFWVLLVLDLPRWAIEQLDWNPSQTMTLPSSSTTVDTQNAARVRSLWKVTGWQSTSVFHSKAELEMAVELWLADREQALLTYGSIGHWDVSSLTDLSGIFRNRTTFDDDLTGWNVSACRNYSSLFEAATQFNGDISTWKLVSAVDMSSMLKDAISFNGNVQGWLRSSTESAVPGLSIRYAQTMESMFEGAKTFEGQGLEHWDTEAVVNMKAMFRGAVALRRVGGDWNVRLVRDLNAMFQNTPDFSQELCWDIHSSANITDMFDNSKGQLHCDSDELERVQVVSASNCWGAGTASMLKSCLIATTLFAFLSLEWTMFK